MSSKSAGSIYPACMLVLMLGAAALSGCSFSAANRLPATPDVTQVYQTVAAALTPPLPAPAETQPPVSTSTPEASRPPGSPAAAQVTDTPPAGLLIATGVAPCNRAAAGNPIDVTIPDETLLQPGEIFSKVWRLQNAGSCTWTLDYRVAFFYGDLMGAPASLPLAHQVLPGQTVEITAEMMAPLAAGTYQGNWMLSTAQGDYFGIGPAGDAAFWVRIRVADDSLGTVIPASTASAVPSPSATATPTPQVAVRGGLTLASGEALDLDSGTLGTGEETDLLYQAESGPYHWLTPQGEALLGVFGSQPPGLAGCEDASMSAAPIAAESLSPGVFLCYRTGEGQLGQLKVVQLGGDYALSLEYLTWVTP